LNQSRRHIYTDSFPIDKLLRNRIIFGEYFTGDETRPMRLRGDYESRSDQTFPEQRRVDFSRRPLQDEELEAKAHIPLTHHRVTASCKLEINLRRQA
jgi:hypothetical protein